MPTWETEPSGPAGPLLCVEGLGVSYPQGDGPALREVSLRVRRGEFLALIGPSGCGKSTLLRAIAGLMPLERGQVRRAADLSLGYLFQRETLLPWRTVLGNVTVPLEVRRVPKAARLRRAQGWLERLGLAGLERRYPHQLSGGQRQRTLLTRTLVYEPELILLDEPLGSLDALARVQLQDVLLELHRESDQTFVLVTHDLDEALSLADRVVVLSARPGMVRHEYAVRWCRSASVLSARMAAGYADLERRLWLDLEKGGMC